MRVLLVSANRLKAPYPVYPLGLDCVAASISCRHEVRVFDLLATGEGVALEQALRDFQPQVVGISLRNVDNTDITRPLSFVEDYKELLGRVRRTTTAPIILGGSGFTIFAGPLMRLLAPDFGIAGEGERLAELLDCLERGVEPAGIPGLLVGSIASEPATPEADPQGTQAPGTPPETPPGAPPETPPGAPPGAAAEAPAGPAAGAASRRRTAEYPAIPPPTAARTAPLCGPAGAAGRIVDPSFYLANGGMLNFQTKRGCPYRCSYCTYPSIEGHDLRLFEPEDVARTARTLEKSGARYLFATDSTFNCSIQHNLAVADALRVASLSIPWGAFFAPVRTPAEYYVRLASSGLTHVEFGTESLSDPVLHSYRKPFCIDDVFREHDKALSAGLNVAHYFMLGGPGETPATLAETLSNVHRLRETVSFFFCGVRVYPGTAVHKRAIEDGQVHEEDDLLQPVYYRSPALAGVDVEQAVRHSADGRANWVIGAGGEQTMRLLERMYARGHAGPLWEKLVR